MNKTLIGCGVVLALVALGALIIFGSFTGTWNSLNTSFQGVNGAKSRYSAALNTCTQKIKGVWAIANQYMDHESKTFQNVARARSGYDTATKAFEDALKSGDTKSLTQAGTDVVNAAMAFRIQIEAYPQLRAVETSTENIRNMEVSVNEIKTALDDWITSIRDYNTYRGSFWPN
ncbi:MAG: LemA family protein, partial [Thermoleophilia bacterium]|nr:LemA family protein [Thermoleophilia bacterium]